MAREIHTTNVPGLDHLMGGGIPALQALVITGLPGTGKTLLCCHMAFAQAARGVPVIIVTATSEPHDKLISEIREFEFFDENRIGQEVVFLSAYSALKKGPREARELLTRSVRDSGAKFLFMDGLRSIRDLWQDEAKLREFMYELGVGLAAAGCVGIYNTEYTVDDLLSFPEATTVDGILALEILHQGARRFRRAEVLKLRGRRHLLGSHSLSIDRTGITITPRLESVVPSDDDFVPTGDRVPFDLPALDGLMEGGVPRESSTLIAGSTGVGKTLLSLHFAAGAAPRNEKALFVSFHEPPHSLVARAKVIGLDVAPNLASGALEIAYQPPSEQETDALIGRILRNVEARGVKRLVIDGLYEVERGIVSPERTRNLLGAVMVALRKQRTTTIFTKEIPKLAGPEVDFSDTPTSLIAENLILLRHVELKGRIKRVLSILKMRASGYDASIRFFDISSKGLVVHDAAPPAIGLLTGTARPIENAGSS